MTHAKTREREFLLIVRHSPLRKIGNQISNGKAQVRARLLPLPIKTEERRHVCHWEPHNAAPRLRRGQCLAPTFQVVPE